MISSFIIGTRGSRLALAQAEIVRNKIIAAQLCKKVEILALRTSGDWRTGDPEKPLRSFGATKGLFTKELEEALMAGKIDIAVHSMKDVATSPPDSLVFAAFLMRGDPRDALISSHCNRIEDLPIGASVGTSSLRREAQLRAIRPDLKIVPLRGNVETRLARVTNGDISATILAVAGLERLGYQQPYFNPISIETMLPAVSQGAIGIQVRYDNNDAIKALSNLNDQKTAFCIEAERALLRVLDGSCHTPIAAMARWLGDNTLHLDGLLASPDGTKTVKLSQQGSNPVALGEELGNRIKAKFNE